MSRLVREANRKRASFVFLAIGYFCVLALLLNIIARLGWFHVRVPGLDGFGARWKWALGAAVCFVGAWYVERSDTGRPK